MAAHKHAELIKAWADGAQIQFRNECSLIWKDTVGQPIWDEENEYRIKPAAPERRYPCSLMSNIEINEAIVTSDTQLVSYGGTEAGRRCANAALRHACDTGQIVTREEFDRAVGDRKARDMAVSRNLRESLKFVFGNHDGLVWHRIDDDYLESILPRVK